MKKNSVYGLFILMTGLLFIAGGVSYAILSYAGIGNKEVSISTNGITFKYTEGTRKIALESAMPMTDSEGKNQEEYFEFDLSGYTDQNYEIPYDITIRKSKDSADIDNDIKLYLTSVDKTGIEEEVKFTDFANIEKYVNENINLTNHNEKLLYSSKVPANSNFTQKYRLRIWISYDADYTQEKYNNAKFDLTVNVYGKGKVKSSSNIEESKKLEAGLYDKDDNLIASWDELVNTYGLDIETDKSDNYYSKIIEKNANLASGTKLVIGNISRIGTESFLGDKSLEIVEIPSSVISIGVSAFEATNIRKVVFAENSSLTTIEDYAFMVCLKLKVIEVPSSVTTIADNAFYDVTSIVYSGSLDASAKNNWGAHFLNPYIEENFVYLDNTKTTLVSYIGDETTVVIPDAVTQIMAAAFYQLTYYKEIYIPNSVVTIGDDAFSGINHIYYTGTATGAPWGAEALN